MRIGLVTAFYDEKFGGNEYYLAKELSKLGHEVFIYVSRYSVPRYGKIRKINSKTDLSNVFVRRLDSFGIKSKGMIWLKNLKNQVKKDNLDVVHIQEWFMPMSFQLRQFRNLVLTQRIERFPLSVKILFYLYGKKVMKRSKAMTTLTTQAKTQLAKQKIKKNIHVIPNGVDTELFKPSKRSNRIFNILFVGRFSDEKGLDILLRAVSRLKFSHKLTLVSAGPVKQKYIEMAKRLDLNFKVVSSLPQSRLSEYYASADVVVIPSLKEPFGFVTLESLSCGTPVIGSDIGGMRDIIHPEIGLKVKPGSTNDLIRALNKMHAVSSSLKNCREFILQNYSWQSTAKKYLEVYR